MLLFFSLIANISSSTAEILPVKEWIASSHDKPLLFYISGDGGLNKFSINLCQTLNHKGFDVVALDAKSYFNNKKEPGQTAMDIAGYLSKKIKVRANRQIAFIGYSFGADVLPFILNRLPKDILKEVAVSFLMASSGSTDFEIHWLDLFGNKKRSMDVVDEINRISDKKIIILNGSDDNNLDLNRITLKKYTLVVLPGGHHFNGDTEEIVEKILKYL